MSKFLLYNRHRLPIISNSTMYYAWGTAPAGLYGDGPTPADYIIPTIIPSISGSGIIQIAHYNQTFYINSNNELFGTGPQPNGELGLGDIAPRYFFTQIPGSWLKIAVGQDFTVGIKTDGTLWHCGSKTYCRDGAGGTAGVNLVFTQIGIDNDWVDVKLGYYHGVATKANGDSHAWGGNIYGQCSQGNDAPYIPTPIRMLNASSTAKIAATGGGTLLIKTDGTLHGCGNQWTSGNASVLTPTLTQIGVDLYKDIQCATYSNMGVSAAIKIDDTVEVWGYSGTGVPGLSGTIAPIPLDGVNTYKAVALVRDDGLNTGLIGIRLDGTLWGIGHNRVNGLGNNDPGLTTTMQQIGTDNGWIGVVGNYDTFIAWK